MLKKLPMNLQLWLHGFRFITEGNNMSKYTIKLDTEKRPRDMLKRGLLEIAHQERQKIADKIFQKIEKMLKRYEGHLISAECMRYELSVIRKELNLNG